MISNSFPLAMSYGLGMVLGFIFYGGLWWTIRQ